MASKGIFELVDVFEELININDKITLNIAWLYFSDSYMSSSKVKKNFENKIYSNNKIKYHGKVFGIDKIKLLQSSDIFILPSYKEAFPISIIEAMATSNALVVTKQKYISEELSSENGILVEKDVKSLIDGIGYLIKNKQKLLQIQKYNRQQAQEKFSKQKYLKNLKKIVMNI